MNKLITIIFATLLILVACQNEPLPAVTEPGDPTQDVADIPPAPQIIEVEIEATAEVLSSGATDEDLDMSSDPAEEDVDTYDAGNDSISAIQAGFGVGPKVQVISPSGQRMIQYVRWDSEPVELSFRLYPLSFDQFLADLPTDYLDIRYYDNFEPSPLDKSVGAPAFEWSGIRRQYAGDETKGVQQTPLPTDVPVGIYFLEMAAGGSIDSLLLFVSENLVTVNGASGEVVAWVSDTNGRPRANIETLLISEEGDVLSRAESDEVGLARHEIGADGAAGPKLVVIRDGDDYSLSGLSAAWGEFQKSRPLSYVSDIRWWAGDPAAKNYFFQVILDQPKYRPGQTINFKVIVRENRDGAYEIVPSNQSIDVALVKNRSQSEQERLIETTVMVSDFGSAVGSLELSVEIQNNEYDLELTFDGEVYEQEVVVSKFDEAKFDIRVRPQQADMMSGDEVTLDIEVLNLDGTPVSFGEIDVAVFELELMSADYPGTLILWDTLSDDFPEYGNLDEFGRAIIQVPMETDLFWWDPVDQGFKLKQPPPISKMGIELTISDAGKNSTHFVPIDVAPFAGEIKTRFEQWNPDADRPFNVSFEARTLKGETLANRTFDFQIGLWDEVEQEFTETVYSINSITDGNGNAKLQIPGLAAGSYQAMVIDPDLFSRLTNVHVEPIDGSEIEYDVPNGIGLTAENEEVLPGESAILYVESPRDGAGFLSVERGSVRRIVPIEFTAPVTRFELPIIEDDAPEIYVAVNGYYSTTSPQIAIEDETEGVSSIGVELGQYRSRVFSVGDASFWTDRVKLIVPSFNKRLNVEIIPSATEFIRGEDGTFIIRVTNQEGVPVSAELSVSMIHEAIVGVGRQMEPPFYDYFYRYDHRVKVFSTSSMERYLRLNPLGGSDGGGYNPDPVSQAYDQHFWRGNLVTDFKGEVEVQLQMPDVPAEWRMTATAITADTQVGESTLVISTR